MPLISNGIIMNVRISYFGYISICPNIVYQRSNTHYVLHFLSFFEYLYTSIKMKILTAVFNRRGKKNTVNQVKYSINI